MRNKNIFTRFAIYLSSNEQSIFICTGSRFSYVFFSFFPFSRTKGDIGSIYRYSAISIRGVDRFRHFRSEDDTRLAASRLALLLASRRRASARRGRQSRSLGMFAATSPRIRTPLHSFASFSLTVSPRAERLFFESFSRRARQVCASAHVPPSSFSLFSPFFFLFSLFSPSKRSNSKEIHRSNAPTDSRSR